MEQKNLILGFDFGEKYSQFCCYDRGTHTAVSIPVKEGEEAVEFPTAIAKKRNEETWKTGPDAEKSAHAENGIWLDNLYEICMGSRICQIENRDYTPGEVLGTFLREALKMIGIERPDQQIQAMMITTGHLTRPFVENVREAYKIIGLPRGRAYLQEHDESFYCHVLNQKPELWSRKVGLFFLKDEEASFSELSISRKTKPATVTVKRGPKAALSIEPMERDRDFCHLMGEAMGNEIYSSVFLVSEEFDLAWADNSLRQLKKNQRRIFGGTNLFAQGACFSAREKVEERRLKGYLFLGKSGTGKSTHSGLWLRHIPNTELLNDDNPAVRIDDEGRAMVFGTPWSGKTPCYKNKSLPIGAIVRLEQAPRNEINRLSPLHAFSSVLSSCSSMIWDKPSFDAITRTSEAVVKRVSVFFLRCLPDEAAARLCHETVANHTSEKTDAQ